MSWHAFQPYVSVAQRRAIAAKHTQKLAKKGQALAPVRLEGRTIARTFWGKAWCQHLESFSDFANRLPRGRTYVRTGSVIDLQIAPSRSPAAMIPRRRTRRYFRAIVAPAERFFLALGLGGGVTPRPQNLDP